MKNKLIRNVSLLLITLCAGCATKNNHPPSIYGIDDVDDLLRGYLLEQKIKSPGRACGFFKNNKKGCFILYKKPKELNLVYKEDGGEPVLIRKFDSIYDFIFLRKKIL